VENPAHVGIISMEADSVFAQHPAFFLAIEEV
jgi:hypothetical protein